MLTRLWVGQFVGSNPGKCQKRPLLPNVQTASGAHTPSYSKDIEIFLPVLEWQKRVGDLSLPIKYRY